MKVSHVNVLIIDLAYDWYEICKFNRKTSSVGVTSESSNNYCSVANYKWI